MRKSCFRNFLEEKASNSLTGEGLCAPHRVQAHNPSPDFKNPVLSPAADTTAAILLRRLNLRAATLTSLEKFKGYLIP